MLNWIKDNSNKLGLSYYEHETKMTGASRSRRPLRYYRSVFKHPLTKKSVTDYFGWEDDIKGGKNMIEQLAQTFKTNRKLRQQPFSFKEYIQAIEAEHQLESDAKAREQQQQEMLQRTIFNNMFSEYCQANQHKVSLRDEKGYYKNWISPTIGQKRLDEIVLLDLERIKHKMEKAGKAPQTIAHIKKIIRQVYHFAIDHDLYSGSVPTLKFLKKQKFNNKRNRYLTPEEAEALLNEVRKHSERTYQQALVSMHTGMRFGEIAALRWQSIRLEQRHILIVDTKNNEERTVHMNDVIHEIFSSLEPGQPRDLVFPSHKGTQMPQVSKTFYRAVDALGLNDGITDRRFKVVFHTLRHSCASWMANSDVDVQVIARVLGHKSLTMTMRYSHINDTSVKDAMMTLQQVQAEQPNVIPLKSFEA